MITSDGKRRSGEIIPDPTLRDFALKQDKKTCELRQNLAEKREDCESGAKIISCDPTPGCLLPFCHPLPRGGGVGELHPLHTNY